jgi:dipeptidyl aminopeptidase/acylaminoacyl peptidase
VQDVASRIDLTPPEMAAGRITGLRFDRGGHHLALTLETAQSPADVYVYDLSRPALQRWTHSEVGPVDPASLVPAELVHFPTWDRVGLRTRILSAYVYRPRGAGPFPVLISLHGGPQDQFRPEWAPFLQFLVNELGYAVVAPNVRGSAGYGRSFAALDDGVLRQDAIRDVGSLLVWIGLQPAFDRQHIAVMGSGAYGGYLALASLAAYSDRLVGGIDVLGISDFVTYLGGQPEVAREQGRLEYGDERDPRMRAFLDRISPVRNVVQIRQPLLMVQWATDPKAPPSEAQQMAWRLRSRGDEVWYVAAKDDGAWGRTGGRDAYLSTAALFLRKLLGENSTATASP